VVESIVSVPLTESVLVEPLFFTWYRRPAHVDAGGTVTVKFFVDETGKVRVPIVIACTTPDLGRAAISAVEQWTYEPPRAANQPTIVLETETFSFKKPKQ